MKKSLPAILAILFIFSISCNKDSGQTSSDNGNAPLKETPQVESIYYDFVITTTAGCKGQVLTINDCGDGSYKTWQSTKNCTGGNQFNGLVANSGNPLLASNPATFPNIGATYLIFNNATTATRDVLSVTFHTGYNASHKPTVSYNPTTRQFTITNAGNPTYVSVSKFSYTGLIQPGVIEFC